MVLVFNVSAYPARLTKTALESTHSEYDVLSKIWIKISDLVNGGHQLESKKADYLKKRPGEKESLYQSRLERFTYDNILGSSINNQVQKLSLGTLNFGNKNQFWTDFLSNMDNKGSSDFDFISEVFRVLLCYKWVYLHVDQTTPDRPIETVADLENTTSRPYVNIIDPLNVTNWETDEFGNLIWLKMRFIRTVSDRFTGEEKTIATWVFVDPIYVAKYEAQVLIKANGKIEIVDPELNPDGEPLVSIVDGFPKQHDFGAIPIIRGSIPDDLWVTNQAYLKAIEHLNLDNAKFDTAMTSGYVQRTIKPKQVTQVSDQDLDLTYVNYRQQQLQASQAVSLNSDNQHVLDVESFTFNEATGAPVVMLLSVLDKLEIRIKTIIGVTVYQGSNAELNQSGIRRDLDMVVQEIFLRKFGEILIKLLNQILPLVAKTRLIQQPLTVNGLDHFNLDNLDDLVNIAVLIQPLESNISPTALKLLYSAIQDLMARNSDPEIQQTIAQETDLIWRSFEPDPTPPKAV